MATETRRSLARALAVLAVLAALLAVRPLPATADEDNIPDQIIVVNTQVTVDVPYDYGNVALGAGIVRLVTLRRNRQILIAGRQPGTTNLTIFDTEGNLRDEVNITVIPANLRTVMAKVQQLLADIEGLSFKIVGDKVYIQGEVSVDEELQRVQALADREPLVENMARLSPIAQRLLAGLIETEIDVPGVRARLINDQIILEGVVHSEAASKRAEAIARAYYDKVTNVLEVREVDRVPGRTQTVVIIAHYVEMAKSLTHSWGISWTPLAVSGGAELFFSSDYVGGWQPVTGGATATITSLLPRLDYARTSGYARVLDNPTISVKSGETASIFSGMEYPYLVASGFVTYVEWKEIGIKVDVTPYAQGNDVDMDIDVTVTALGEVAPNGYQAVEKSELHTSEYCRAGESVVIGGLQRINDKVDYNRVPESVPEGSLVTLYKNKDYKKGKSQFLVFLTPQIHESSSSANREIKDQFNLQEVRQ